MSRNPPADLLHYRAPWWLPGGHAQTIWAAVASRRHLGPAPRFVRERWDTPDGDFIDVDRATHDARHAGGDGDRAQQLIE